MKPSVISALVVVVIDVETGELGEVDLQSTAGVVEVLTVQGQLGMLGTPGLLAAASPRTGCSW